MSRPIYMNVGDYVIINEVDRPCTLLIVQVTSIERTIVHARYICENTMMKKCSGPLYNVTLIEDFGVKIKFHDGSFISTYQILSSIATYKDGKIRNCQQAGEEEVFHKLRK